MGSRDDTFRLDDSGAGDDAPGPAMDVPAASQGRYRQESVLGEGGMGRVTSVRDQVLHRAVALKALKPNSGTAARERFLREARVTARLEHPNIVPVHELGRGEDGALYYTMKQVGGGSLGEAIAARSTLDERLELLVHFVDLCQAVAYAHDQGVLHRDLKPANVMVGAYGETLLLDWGLARVDGETETAPHQTLQQLHPSHTLDGSVMGTAAYMSPEQARGEQASLDARSDVWSLGMVLYELLSGEPPFRGLSTEAILEQVQQARVPPLPSQVPAELASVMERCLAARPEDRYATALAVADEVEAWRTGGWVRAHRYGLWQRLVRRLSRNPSLTAALTVLALVMAMSPVVLGVLLTRTEAALQTAREAESRAQQAMQRAEVTALLERSLTEEDAGVPTHALALAWAAWERSERADARAAAALRRLSSAAAFELQPHDQQVEQVLLFGSTVVSRTDAEVVAWTTAGELARLALEDAALVRAGERVLTVEGSRACLREVQTLEAMWCRTGRWRDARPAPDGRALLFAGDEALVQVRLADGVDQVSVPDPAGAIAWSADGGRVLTAPGTGLGGPLAAAPPGPHTLTVRDAATLEGTRTLPLPGPVVGLATDATTRWAAFQHVKDPLDPTLTEVWLVDLDRGRSETVAELNDPAASVRLLAPPPGTGVPGVLVGSLLYERHPTGWMRQDRTELRALNPDAALSPPWLAVVDNLSVHLVDQRDRFRSAALPGPARPITAVDVQASPRRVVVGTHDGTVQLHEVLPFTDLPGEPGLDLPDFGTGNVAPVADPDRSWFLRADRRALTGPDALDEALPLQGPSDRPEEWLPSPDGWWLGAADDGWLRIWHPGTGELVHEMTVPVAAPHSALERTPSWRHGIEPGPDGTLVVDYRAWPSFSADGRCATTLQAGANQSVLQVLELDGGAIRTIQVDEAIAVAWLADRCGRLVGVNEDGEAGTWVDGTWHGWGVAADWMSVAPDGRTVVGGRIGEPGWWRTVTDGEVLAQVPARAPGDQSFQVEADYRFTPDGQALIVRKGRSLHIFHADGRQLDVEHEDEMVGMYPSNGFVAGLHGHDLQIWDLEGHLLVKQRVGYVQVDGLGRYARIVRLWWSGEREFSILRQNGHIERIQIPPQADAAAEHVARSTNLRVCAGELRVVRDPEPGPDAWARAAACDLGGVQ